MQDNALITIIIGIINAGLTQQGVTATVQQAFQPTSQGVPTAPTVTIYKVADHRYGFRGAEDVYDPDTGNMNHTETQQYETTFQISALVTQNPATPSAMTGSDLVNLVAAILQLQPTVDSLAAQDIGILRVTDVRNPYFQNDRAQNEASPSFDFVLTHKQVIVTTGSVADPITLGIYPI